MKSTNVWDSIKAGLAYLWQNNVLRSIFILLVAINLFVIGPFQVGIPVLAKRNLAEGAAAFGILVSAFGGGSLLGIILASVLPKPKPAWFGTVLLGVTGLLGVGLILLVVSTSTPIVALICLAMGTTMGYVNIKFMTWLQRRVARTDDGTGDEPDHVCLGRGRTRVEHACRHHPERQSYRVVCRCGRIDGGGRSGFDSHALSAANGARSHRKREESVDRRHPAQHRRNARRPQHRVHACHTVPTMNAKDKRANVHVEVIGWKLNESAAESKV